MPRCPACGFGVFNRRYPKCESCGAKLPAAMLYTKPELDALRSSEVEQLEHELERQREASKAATAAAQQAALAALIIVSGGN